ncbi:MAG TPA: MarR family transcriptional regulator [Candidatus Dormibacteraeota bacterium]|nr:MarR family transcriptional regulator [Candidatus Dormibacteraeota bacterium]
MQTILPEDQTPVTEATGTGTDAVGAGTEPVVDGIIAGFQAAWRELRCIGSERMLRLGLTPGHLHAMSILDRHGELPMSGLADSLDVSLSNMTGLVDRMEERGLVERHRVPDDRRVVMVRITDGGRAALAQADLLKEETLRSILAALDASRLERLAAAVADVREAVETVLLGETPSDWHEHAHRHGHPHGGDRRPHSPAA